MADAEALHKSPDSVIANAPMRPAPRTWGRWALLEFLPRLIVSAVFVYAAAGKLDNPIEFAKEIRQYRIVPLIATHMLAFVLPWLELFCAAFLLIGFFRREARFLLFAMLLGFTAAKIAVLAQGRDIHCGCVPETSVFAILFKGWYGVVTNLVLMTLLTIEGASGRRPRAKKARPGGTRR